MATVAVAMIAPIAAIVFRALSPGATSMRDRRESTPARVMVISCNSRSVRVTSESNCDRVGLPAMSMSWHSSLASCASMRVVWKSSVACNALASASKLRRDISLSSTTASLTDSWMWPGITDIISAKQARVSLAAMVICDMAAWRSARRLAISSTADIEIDW